MISYKMPVAIVLMMMLNPAHAEDSTPIQQAKVQIAEYGKALDMFYVDCDRYPTTAEGLEALMSLPRVSCKNWGPDPYVKEIVPDPWGHPYIYKNTGADLKSYTLKSLGADGHEGGTGENMDLFAE